MPVNDGVKLPWMTRVADGVGIAYHQHLFNLCIDPAIDGFSNTVAYEDSERTPDDPVLDPYGVGYYYQDGELYAAGEFTNQSAADSGLAVLTHNPRPEDFPVMPMEMIKVELQPTSFFTMNPSNDVPRSNQKINRSVLVPSCCEDPATPSRL
ncbi:Amine oxidase [Fusarium keratoplasticum]|nr:Amine oxidase [Fusarium keratoplasticum]